MKYNLRALLILIFLPACDGMLGTDVPIYKQNYLQPPPALDDGLAVSSPVDEGLDSARLYDLVREIQNAAPDKLRSILIARNNKLVFEAYFGAWHRDRKQDLRSASKSFVSAVMGIAIDKGVVKDVDQPVLSYFPEYESIRNWDDRKAEMTIRDFLRMRTGLSCNDWVPYSQGNEEYMYETDDWIRFVFDLPVMHDPGEQFSYCSGAPIVLSAVITKSWDEGCVAFADEYLFKPLGITDYVWEYMPARREYAGGKLHMRPRDALKLGLLFLNDGTWNGTQVISPEWIAESTRPDGVIPTQREGVEYGYYWWYTTWTIDGQEIEAYYAHGNGGQVMYVLEDLNMVVLFTGGAYNTNAESRCYHIMRRTILPAVK